jgi:hypothetical protein
MSAGSTPSPKRLPRALIRDVALAAEMVDAKVCAIDETWSGLRLTCAAHKIDRR